MTELDNEVRVAIYERFVDEGEPPSAADVAEALSISTEDAEAAFRRLEEAHVIVLRPGTVEVWMANPLSAVPTAFRVENYKLVDADGLAHFAVPARRWWENVGYT